MILQDDEAADEAEAIVGISCFVLLLIVIVGVAAGYYIGKNKYEPSAVVEAAKKAQTLEECYGVAYGLNVNPKIVCTTLTYP